MDTVIVAYREPASASAQEGKFLQLRWQGRQYLLFAPLALYRYHNQLLARFLCDHDLACQWTSPEHLQINAHDVEVLGGGRFRVDPAAGTLALWDDSHAYGRFRQADLEAGIAAADHSWSGFRVTIA